MVSMPAHIFHPGDACSCTAVVCNATGSTLFGYPLFVILDVYGSYFFAPSFGPYDNYMQQYPEFAAGETMVEVLPAFEWPAGVGSAGGLMWYGALTDPVVTNLFGKLGTWEFGWEN